MYCDWFETKKPHKKALTQYPIQYIETTYFGNKLFL